MSTRINNIMLVSAFLLLLISCRPAEIGSPALTDPYPIPPQGAQVQPSPYPPPTAEPILKPADSQEIVSGICEEAAGETVDILLTPDGPASPRCVKIHAEQRLKFINGRDAPVLLVFGPFSEAISPGGEALLDREAGEYLAPGIHLVEGAEIMLLGSAAYPPPAGGSPPLERYTNKALGYSLAYPAGWSLDDRGMSQLTKEVILSPPEAEPFELYFIILLDPRSLDGIRGVYAETTPDAEQSEVAVGGLPEIQYTYPRGRIEIYLDHRGQVIQVSTDRPDRGDVQAILASLAFG